MQIRKIVDIMGFDLDENRIGFERADFENIICDFKFDLPLNSWNTWEITLPDTDHVTVYKNAQKFELKKLNAIMEIIHREVPDSVEYDDEMVFSVFSILHEIGHLRNYEEKGMNKTDYIQEDQVERQKISNIKEFEDAFEAYRNLPNEKAADRFAFKCLIDELEKIKNVRE